MLFSKKTELYIAFQSLILSVLYVIYIIGGYKSFNVWSQLDIFAGVNPLLVLDHPHGLRYLITWPVLWLSEFLDVHRNVIFSIFVVANLIVTTLLTAAVQARISHALESRWRLWVYLFAPIFITLSFAMNGRLSYMMLGISLMLYAYTRWLSGMAVNEPLGKAFLWCVINMLALVLLSVSSGCFTVGMLLVAAQTCVMVAMPIHSWKKYLLNIALNIGIIAVFVLIQFNFIQKNLDFYGGSIFAMMVHGPGKIFYNMQYGRELTALLSAIVVFIGVCYSQKLKHLARVVCSRYYLLITPVSLVIISLLVGVFGYSALLTGSTAAMILVVHFIGTLNQAGQLFTAKYPVSAFFYQDINRQRVLTAALMSVVSAAVIMVSPAPVAPQYGSGSLDDYKWMLRWDDNTYYTKMTGSMDPTNMTHDTDGNIYFVENQNRILRIQKQRDVELFAGDYTTGDVDGDRRQARFNKISDIAADSQGNLYVADEENNKIKKIDKDGMVTTVLGNGRMGRFYSWCKPLECRITSPKAITVLQDDSVVVSTGLQLIRFHNNGVPVQFFYVQEVKKKDDGTLVTVP